jgi:hypothetical protein
MLGAHLLCFEGRQYFNLYLNKVFKLEFLGSRAYMTHLHNEVTKASFRFVIPRPPTILGAHTTSFWTLTLVVNCPPPHKKLHNKVLHLLTTFLAPPIPQTLMKNHNEDTNTKLIMRVLLTRCRWIKNQYLSFFFKHFMKNLSMFLVSKSILKGLPRRLRIFFAIHLCWICQPS